MSVHITRSNHSRDQKKNQKSLEDSSLVFCAMDDSREGKVTGIRQIVRLKGFLQKWQAVTFGPRGGCSPRSSMPTRSPEYNYGRAGISPEVSRRIMSSSAYYDSDDDSCHSPEPPSDVPKGYLAVYVGPELRRFIIPTSYLSNSLFKVLLEKAEEEYGFDHRGGLTLPCEIETFKYLLQCMENHEKEQAGSSSVQE